MSVVVEKELPKGWARCKIDDIVDVIRGASPRPKGDPRYFGGDIPWIMISDISREKGKFITKTKDHVTVEGSKKSRLLKKGSLILSNSGTVCVPKILGVDGCIHDGFVTFPNIEKNIQVLFAYYLFEYIRPRIINENKQGITQVNLNTTIVKNIEFLLPPINEQKRIVAKIEELFSLVDSAKDTLEKTNILLKQYRQSILKHAFEGKLVRQDPNDESASALLEKIKIENPKKKLVNIVFNKELPKGWASTNLIKIAEPVKNSIVDGPFGSNLKVSDYDPDGEIPVLTISLFYNITKITEARKINYKKFEQIERSKVIEGDILIAKIGNTYGLTCIYPKNFPVAMIPANICKITPNSKVIETKFLKFWLDSKTFKKFLDSIVSSTAQPAFNISNFKQLPIPLPPQNEQKRIVAKIEESFSLIEKNEILIDQLLIQYKQIKNSILKQAFEGKLVPQDPNDEPAEVLLQRIREEKNGK